MSLALVCVAAALSAASAAVVVDSWAMLHRVKAPAERTCIDIPANFTLCHGIEYPRMRLPNLLEHDTLNEVTVQSRSWVPLLRLNCHPDAQLFLCSLFAPVCLQVDRDIYPCRSLCEAVQEGCEKRMRLYGFPWPPMLNCAQYPSNSDMCIKPRVSYQNQSCSACNQVDTYENILDHFCQSKYVARVKLYSVEPTYLSVKSARSLMPTDWRRQVRRDRYIYYSRANQTCPCEVAAAAAAADGRAERAGRRSRRRRRFLVMADEDGDGNLFANLILPWNRRQKRFRRAVKMFRSLNCASLGSDIRERARREQTHRRPYTDY